MDTAMLLALGLLQLHREPKPDARSFGEGEGKSARRLAVRAAGALAVLAIAIAALDLAARNAATATGECHDCIAEYTATDGGADLARADTARSR